MYFEKKFLENDNKIGENNEIFFLGMFFEYRNYSSLEEFIKYRCVVFLFSFIIVKLNLFVEKFFFYRL